LGAGGAKQLGALAVEEDQRAQVDPELEVDLPGVDLVDGRTEPDPGAVDEHVEAPEVLAVRAHDLLYHGLLTEVAGDRVDLEALLAQPGGGGLELLGPPRRAGRSEEQTSEL